MKTKYKLYATGIKMYPHLPVCPECGLFLVYEGEPHVAPCSKNSGSIPKNAVEYTVYRVYAQYPVLFGRNEWTRWHIFHHLFFVNGNGYTWKKGALIPVRDKHFQVGKPLRFKTGREYALEWIKRREMNKTEAEIQRFARKEKYMWATSGRKPFSVYPLSEHSMIFQIPEDAHYEWLVAAVEAIEMAFDIGLENQREEWVHKLKEVSRTIEALL